MVEERGWLGRGECGEWNERCTFSVILGEKIELRLTHQAGHTTFRGIGMKG
jgi:hypothetical protein